MNEIKISCQDFLNTVTLCSDGWFSLSMASKKTRQLINDKIHLRPGWFDRIYTSKTFSLYRLSDAYYSIPGHLNCASPRRKKSNDDLYRMLLWAGYCLDNNLIIPFSSHDKATVSGHPINICPLNQIDRAKKGIFLCCEITSSAAKNAGIKHIVPSFARTSSGQSSLIFAHNFKNENLIIDHFRIPASTDNDRNTLANFKSTN